jgi:DNA-binding transcriptional ArsR family regulator/uncharacterized protein YndB with AHSA1/START domain
VDDVFRALADPTRRRLLDSLNGHNGQTLRSLCAGLGMSRQSVSKHLAILEGANLITTLRQGREKLHYLNAAPIADLSDRWINRYDRQRVEALTDLKRALEDPLPTPPFVYTTYIRTTPEQLWNAITEPAFTRRYWGLTFDTDWQEGSTYTMHFERRGVSIEDPGQVVLESDPYRRLAYTWHAFTPEWGAAFGADAERLERLAAEPRSKVTFELEPTDDDTVKLTVVHDGFPDGSLVVENISRGWPRMVAGLKTLLETGEAFSPGPS